METDAVRFAEEMKTDAMISYAGRKLYDKIRDMNNGDYAKTYAVINQALIYIDENPKRREKQKTHLEVLRRANDLVIHLLASFYMHEHGYRPATSSQIWIKSEEKGSAKCQAELAKTRTQIGELIDQFLSEE